MHVLRLALDRYYEFSTGDYPIELARGSHRIEARFAGWEGKTLDGDTMGIAQLRFWTGTVRPNVATFTLR